MTLTELLIGKRQLVIISLRVAQLDMEYAVNLLGSGQSKEACKKLSEGLRHQEDATLHLEEFLRLEEKANAQSNAQTNYAGRPIENPRDESQASQDGVIVEGAGG